MSALSILFIVGVLAVLIAGFVFLEIWGQRSYRHDAARLLMQDKPKRRELDSVIRALSRMRDDESRQLLAQLKEKRSKTY